MFYLGGGLMGVLSHVFVSISKLHFLLLTNEGRLTGLFTLQYLATVAEHYRVGGLKQQ